MSIVQSQIQATSYFAHNKSSRGKRMRKFNGSMIISKTSKRKAGKRKPKRKVGRRKPKRKVRRRRRLKGKAKKEGKRRRRNHQEEKGQRV